MLNSCHYPSNPKNSIRPRMLLLCCLLGLPACASSKGKVVVTKTIPVQEQPLPIAGTQVAVDNLDAIRTPGNYKAYPFGRQVDSSDPSVLHERHLVYRQEDAERHNLQPTTPLAIPLGPATAVSDPARQPNPMTAEFEQSLVRQNQIMAVMIEQNTALTKDREMTQKKLQELEKVLQTLDAERSSSAQAAEELKRVRTELAVLQEKQEKREKEGKPAPVPDAPSHKKPAWKIW